MADLPGTISTALARPTTTEDGALRTAENPDLQTALDELGTATRGYRKAEQYYDDHRPEAFASIRLRRAMARTGDNFRLNFAATPVDVVADRCEVTSVTADTDDATKALHDLWADNQLDLEFPNVIRRACEYGDAYLIVWPSDDDEAEDVAETPSAAFASYPSNDPRRLSTAGTDDTDTALHDTDHDGYTNVDVFYNSPQSVRLFYDPEKPIRKAFAVKRWEITGKRTRVDLYYRDRLERFVTVAGKKRTGSTLKARDLVPYTEDGQAAVLDNPFGVIPVFHFRTDRPYGVPEHARFYGVQDLLRKLVVSHASGVDYQAFPQRYALMDPETDTSEAATVDEDEFSFPLDTGATAHAGRDPQSQLTSDPGSFWQLRGMRAVGQFNEADPKTFIDPMTWYLRAGAQLSTTPLHYFDPSGGSPSGESLRVAESPLVKKVKNRHASFGAALREALEFALLLMGYPDATVTVHWQSPASVDDLTGWQIVRQKTEAGMPVRQAFLEAGYTQEQVTDWFGEDNDDLPFRVDILAKVMGALQSASAAAATGMFTEEEIRAFVSVLLEEADLPVQAEQSGPMWEPASKTGAPGGSPTPPGTPPAQAAAARGDTQPVGVGSP